MNEDYKQAAEYWQRMYEEALTAMNKAAGKWAHADALLRLREEIVRCKDCVWYDPDYYLGKWCTNLGFSLQEQTDGFCAWGKRRERETAEVWNQWSADDVTCSEES